MKSKAIGSVISLFLIISTFILAACESYDGFIRYNIPDELVGTVMLPEGWKIVTDEEGWIQFIDTATEEVMAEEIRREWYGKDNECEEHNPKYSEFFPLEYVSGTAHSNGGQHSISKIASGDEIITWNFHADTERYRIQIYIIREDFSEDFIRKIASSYRYIGRE